ncbi:MAG: hypothetical protein ACJAQ3_002499 [Planctomycetota bacterium]|jgi:hypothetical protein
MYPFTLRMKMPLHRAIWCLFVALAAATLFANPASALTQDVSKPKKVDSIQMLEQHQRWKVQQKYSKGYFIFVPAPRRGVMEGTGPLLMISSDLKTAIKPEYRALGRPETGTDLYAGTYACKSGKWTFTTTARRNGKFADLKAKDLKEKIGTWFGPTSTHSVTVKLSEEKVTAHMKNVAKMAKCKSERSFSQMEGLPKPSKEGKPGDFESTAICWGLCAEWLKYMDLDKEKDFWNELKKCKSWDFDKALEKKNLLGTCYDRFTKQREQREALNEWVKDSQKTVRVTASQSSDGELHKWCKDLAVGYYLIDVGGKTSGHSMAMVVKKGQKVVFFDPNGGVVSTKKMTDLEHFFDYYFANPKIERAYAGHEGGGGNMEVVSLRFTRYTKKKK